MRKVVKKLEMGVDVPLVIDTTELDVLEIALKTAPGRCLINSTHLESGRAKADKIFALAKDPQRRRHRPDHRRKRHGQDRATENWKSPSASTISPSTTTACAPTRWSSTP